MSKEAASNLCLTFLLYAARPPLASVDVICMCIMAAERSMQTAMMGRNLDRKRVGFDPPCLVCCRGMLAVPAAGRSAAQHGAGGDGSGEERTSGMPKPSHVRNGVSAGEAGPSRTVGRTGMGGEFEALGAWSDAD